MKKQTRREKVVAVQEKRLESVKGGSGYNQASGRIEGDPDAPSDGSGGG